MRRHWFSPQIRRGRFSYLISVSIAFLIMFSGIFFSGENFLLKGIFLMPFGLAILFLTAQRIRDFNVTGWLVMAWVPIQYYADVNFYIGDQLFSYTTFIFPIFVALIPGTKGPNRYGD